jgi:hypothetical protein
LQTKRPNLPNVFSLGSSAIFLKNLSLSALSFKESLALLRMKNYIIPKGGLSQYNQGWIFGCIFGVFLVEISG